MVPPPATSPGDQIAALALIVSIVAALISSGSLFLEIRRWFEAGPKMNIRVIPDAEEMPPARYPRPMLAMTVTNRGNTATTITSMLCFAQHPRWQFWRRQPLMTGIVPDDTVPFEIGINQRWMGRLNYDDRLSGFRAKGQLYVGVACSHSPKNFLRRVPPQKSETPKIEVGT
jgi:hypothetical protein